MAHKWRLIGVQLGVNPAELDQIASENVYMDRCSFELFRKWSAGEITAFCPCTWEAAIETLVSCSETLDSESVGESSPAINL